MLGYFAVVLVRWFEKRRESGVRFPAGTRIFFLLPHNVQTGFWPTSGLNVRRLGESQSIVFNEFCFTLRQEGRGVKLTSDLHLVRRLRKSTHLFQLYALMELTGTSFTSSKCACLEYLAYEHFVPFSVYLRANSMEPSPSWTVGV